MYAEAGEDLIASCPACDYAANMDKATSQLPRGGRSARETATPELVHTPGRRTIEDVGAFLQLEPAHQIKTMAYMALTQAAKAGAAEIASPVVVLLRGDHTVNLAKLTGLFPARPRTAAHGAEEILNTFHSPAGYLGPIGLDILGRRRAGGGREGDGHFGSRSRGTPQPGRRRQPGGISSAQCDPGARFCSYPDRGRPQRDGGGKLPAMPGGAWECAEGGQSHRSRAHFQAGLPVFRRHGHHGYWTPMARK